ncbi:unnamed protein product [Didymodactylos carnosus]|uniref:Large ribosomal subunit protein bL20m n=1 Tax=Didymodactylos carnosus TaxID=1234261 RepID=A0A813UIR3_9BILA|nr:unnamed protein product [Didymodactylos carnosus]CAF3609879.1 unnamed protein product [Didymodactylos carnosus]
MVFLSRFFHKLPTPVWQLKETIPGNRTDRRWWRMETFRFTFNADGRRRHCFSIAIRYMKNRWRLASRNRQIKKIFYRELWETRINAGAMEHGLRYPTLHASLLRQNILLNKPMLSDLAIYEPRTFECLTLIAKQHISNTGLKIARGLNPEDQDRPIVTSDDHVLTPTLFRDVTKRF